LNDEQLIEFKDESEKFVLWSLEAMLEKILPEPFHPNYAEILSKAQEEVKSHY
jgi:hypothetical protein